MVTPTLSLEKSLWQKGHEYVCGIDEVGRGSFAGPVVAGAVIFPPNVTLPDGIADSKLLTPQKRRRLAIEIKKVTPFFAIAEIGVSKINKYGIGKATQMAFRKAVKSIKNSPDFVSLPEEERKNLFILIDAFFIKALSRKKQMAVKGGDKICASISAASIIAKVYRDELMKKLHKKYPNYGFKKHKGYGTKFHQGAIRTYGLSKLHRKSFSLSKFLSSKREARASLITNF